MGFLTSYLEARRVRTNPAYAAFERDRLNADRDRQWLQDDRAESERKNLEFMGNRPVDPTMGPMQGPRMEGLMQDEPRPQVQKQPGQEGTGLFGDTNSQREALFKMANSPLSDVRSNMTTLAGQNLNPPNPDAFTAKLNLLRDDPALAQQFTDVYGTSGTDISTNVYGGGNYEKKYDTERGLQDANAYNRTQKAGRKGRSDLQKLNRLEALIDSGLDTGKFAPLRKELNSVLSDLGMDTFTDDLSEAEMFTALTNRMALAVRQTSGGEGMPGQMSDADRQFLVDSVMTLSKSEGGNKLVLDYYRRLAKRDQEISRMARAYEKKKGRFDDGFYDELAAWSDQNPLFSQSDRDAAQKVIQPTTPAPAPAAAPDLAAAARAEIERRRNASRP